jgi:hypothetical protein
MSSRKRYHGPKKTRLRARLIIYACVLLAPMLLGGACGAFSLVSPQRKTFGDARHGDEPQKVTTAQVVHNGLIGVGVGAAIGVVACLAYTWSTRQKKPKF